MTMMLMRFMSGDHDAHEVAMMLMRYMSGDHDAHEVCRW